MRLRKNMKRAAAAALALSVALSAAAPTALAKDYYIENGDITVTVTKEGETYVQVGDAEGVKDDNVVIKGGKDPNKPAGTNSDGSADEVEKQKPVVDAEPGEPAENTGTELIVWPENAESGEAQEKDDSEPADTEPKTPDTQKPVEEAAEDDDDIMTYEDNTASTVTKAVSEAVNHIITIINNCTKKDTTVTIEDVNIDVRGYMNKSALSVEGAGDTTLKLKGKNMLQGSVYHAGLEKNSTVNGKGEASGKNTGKLTITADSIESGKLTATGGGYGAGIGASMSNDTANIEISGGTIEATGGIYGSGIGTGSGGNAANIKISGGKVTAKGGIHGAGIGTGSENSRGIDNDAFNIEISGGDVTAIGGGAGIGGGTRGNAYGIKISGGTVYAEGASGIGGGWSKKNQPTQSGRGGYGEVTITGGKVTAIGKDGGAGIGGGAYGKGNVTISGTADVTAKGGKTTWGEDGAAIGDGGNEGTGEERADLSGMTGGTVIRLDAKSNIPADHVHEWTETGRETTADGSAERVTYSCECGTLRTVVERLTVAAEENSSDAAIVLTVTDAPTYEMYYEEGRYVITADSDTATLLGCLGSLADLKAQGADTLVFRTKSRETALDIDAMLSLGAEDTLFALTHNGADARLTVGGVEHNELL